MWSLCVLRQWIVASHAYHRRLVAGVWNEATKEGGLHSVRCACLVLQYRSTSLSMSASGWPRAVLDIPPLSKTTDHYLTQTCFIGCGLVYMSLKKSLHRTFKCAFPPLINISILNLKSIRRFRDLDDSRTRLAPHPKGKDDLQTLRHKIA